MAKYSERTAEALGQEAAALQAEYKTLQAKGLKLDLSRGKPDKQQLDLAGGLLGLLDSSSDFTSEDGTDTRNYGGLLGIPEARRLMAGFMDLSPDEVIVTGNSSLNMMHEMLAMACLFGLKNSPAPWSRLPVIKFLCPCPGYDRHFAVTEHLGFELVPVPMLETGPDMDAVEQLVADEAVKGIWCVPKYANPTGTTYSDDTVRRLAALTPAAPDFVIMWDNAYAVHDLDADHPDHLLDLMAELKKNGKEDMVLMFCSTSKVTTAGSGISAAGMSVGNLAYVQKHMALQTIGYDKVNQLRHARFLKDMDGVRAHMKKHAMLLRPKFDAVLDTLEEMLGDLEIASWTTPRGGYFISLDTLEGCAKRTVELCKLAGVVMTPAGASFPYGKDPQDRNIRIAPTFATPDEVLEAAQLFALCVKIASVEKLLGQPVIA